MGCLEAAKVIEGKVVVVGSGPPIPAKRLGDPGYRLIWSDYIYQYKNILEKVSRIQKTERG